MKLIQKIIIAIGLIAIASFWTLSKIGDGQWEVTLKYNENIVSYLTKSTKEYESIKMRSDNNCLFFNGTEFFVNESSDVKEECRVVIIDSQYKQKTGFFSVGQLAAITLLILIIMVFCYSLFIDMPDEYFYHGYH